MAVTASMVKELRDMTGCGMMECKKALVETDGDMNKAVDYLRERGLAKAEKKAGRIAAEGIVAAYEAEDGTYVLAEINSETDFAAKSDAFQVFAQDVMKQIAANKPADVATLLAQPCMNDASMTIEEYTKQIIAKLSENLSIRRFAIVEKKADSITTSYIHMGGKIGVLVELGCEGNVNEEEAKAAAKNIAMQVAAANPKFLDRSAISAEFIEHEKAIQRAAALAEGKPEKIVDKMVDGRIEKYMKEICLVDQAYIIDPDMNVTQYLNSVGKAMGATVTIRSFVRFEKGEGIEKKEDNFAEEVAKQAGL